MSSQDADDRHVHDTFDFLDGLPCLFEHWVLDDTLERSMPNCPRFTRLRYETEWAKVPADNESRKAILIPRLSTYELGPIHPHPHRGILYLRPLHVESGPDVVVLDSAVDRSVLLRFRSDSRAAH